MEFFDLLVKYEVGLWAAVDESLRHEGMIGAAELQALSILDEHAGSGRVHELSAGIGITVGAASKFVDRLERDGLVLRKPNPSDRRSSLVVLTEPGMAALAEAARVRESVLQRVLDPEASQAAGAALTTLLARLERTRSGVLS